jgi:hypothetical protein
VGEAARLSLETGAPHVPTGGNPMSAPAPERTTAPAPERTPAPTPSRTPLPLLRAHQGGRSAMTCAFRCDDACSKPVPNESDNAYFGDLVSSLASRRGVLKGGGLAAAVVGLGAFAGTGTAAAPAGAGAEQRVREGGREGGRARGRPPSFAVRRGRAGAIPARQQAGMALARHHVCRAGISRRG